jgi:hypothetical protein
MCRDHASTRSERAANGGVEIDHAPAHSNRRPRSARDIGSGAAVHGTITDAAGTLAGARVCAATTVDELTRSTAHAGSCATSGTDGTYVLADLPPGRYAIRAVADRHLPGERGNLELAAGEQRTGADLELIAGGVEITGTVSDRIGGPIAHALVATHELFTGARSGDVETDDTGRYHLWTWAGRQQVTASADGYADATADTTGPAQVDLSLAPGGTISGTVIDAATRAPVADAVVSVTTRGDDTDHATPRELTDEQGRFRIDNLEPDRYYLVARSDHGFGVAVRAPYLALGGDVTDVAIELRPAYMITGTVVTDDTPPRSCPTATLTLWRDHTDVATATGAPDGTVSVRGVLPGVYTVTVACAGYVIAVDEQPIELTTRDVTQLRWVATAGGRIHGVVRGPDGTPVAGAHVAITNTDAAATSARDGSYELRGLPAGVAGLEARASAGIARFIFPHVIAGATTEQDITLEPVGAIAGGVVDNDGRPAAHVEISAALPFDYVKVSTGADGRFRFEAVPVGTYHVEAFDGAQLLHEQANVTAGATTTISFHVPTATMTLRGSVVDTRGQAVSAAIVIAWQRGYRGLYAGQTQSDGMGSFEIPGLPLYEYDLDARAGDARAGAHASPDAPTRLVLHAPATIDGNVYLGSAPMNDFTIAGDVRAQRFVGTNGHFHLDDESPGSLRIEAFDRALNTATALVTVGDGASTNVDLALAPVVTVIGQLPAGSQLAAYEFATDYTQDVTVDGSGRFTLENVPRGTLYLHYYRPGARPGNITRDLGTASGTVDLGDILVDPAQPPEQ